MMLTVKLLMLWMQQAQNKVVNVATVGTKNDKTYQAPAKTTNKSRIKETTSNTGTRIQDFSIAWSKCWTTSFRENENIIGKKEEAVALFS